MPTTFQNPQALTKCATEKPHSILHDSTLTPPQKPYRAVFGQNLLAITTTTPSSSNGIWTDRHQRNPKPTNL